MKIGYYIILLALFSCTLTNAQEKRNGIKLHTPYFPTQNLDSISADKNAREAASPQYGETLDSLHIQIGRAHV